ncbi:hypothetical protein PHA51_09420 [Rodentibacter pneumotropicus]|uniref:hypothetical protein n=1 Tax=Rodentibacter pneumotropicus TaxID=758 RepID=UPI0023314D54|nr:hypothetical protein [Rodentibacter pneumotropicus]MDC2826245.1 hypothetical protein [Rodentibacter pneumotropicus]
MNKNLKNLICASAIISIFFSFYTDSREFVEKRENLVTCSIDSFGNHECLMKYHGKNETFKVKYDTCPSFDISINSDVVEVFCSPVRDYSNYTYYKYIDDDLLFFKYNSAFGGNDSLVDKLSYKTDSPYLISLKKNFYDDMKNNTIPQLGFIKSKTFLFDKNGSKSKMYLVKDDKVLILSSRIDKANKKWYRVFYSGKKDIDMWIEADQVYIN